MAPGAGPKTGPGATALCIDPAGVESVMPEDRALYLAACRGCGQKIHFIRSAIGGKQIPCNTQRRFLTPGEGTDAIVDDEGRVIRGTLASEDADIEPGMVGGYVSHFATCSKAGAFRKGKV